MATKSDEHTTSAAKAGAVGPTGEPGAADRAANWMLFAMVACCAAIPLALLIVVVTGSSTFATVSWWGWALLAAAFVAAMVMVHRVMGQRGH